METIEAATTSTSSSKPEEEQRAMNSIHNPANRERRSSRRPRVERMRSIAARHHQRQPLRHHSDHVRPSTIDDDFEAVAMVELERASTDAATVGDRLFAQHTSSFSVNRMPLSSSTVHQQQQQELAPAVTPRIASTPLTPPAGVRNHHRPHRRSSSEGFNSIDSRSAMDTIDIRSTVRENNTRTQPGAYIAHGPPVDVPTWMVHQAVNTNNDNSRGSNRRFRLSQEDRMDSVTFRRWLDSQEEEQQDETSMELFAAAQIEDSTIEASVDVCIQATPIMTTSKSGGGSVVDYNSSQATLLEQSFNSIPPEYRPICTYTPPLSPTAVSSSASEESVENPQQERSPKSKRVRKLMKKLKKVTKEVTKEIVDLM